MIIKVVWEVVLVFSFYFRFTVLFVVSVVEFIKKGIRLVVLFFFRVFCRVEVRMVNLLFEGMVFNFILLISFVFFIEECV